MWYLPFIVVTEILACAISKLFNKISGKVILLLAVCVGTLSYYLLRLHSLFMELETVIYLFPFFVLGFLLKDIDFLKHRCDPVVGIMLILAGSALGKFNGAPGYLSDTYNNYLLFLISTFCICIGIISLVQWADIKCLNTSKTPFLLLKFERKSCYFFFILKSKSFQFFCKATTAVSFKETKI